MSDTLRNGSTSTTGGCLTLASDWLSISVATLGAELQRITDPMGHDLLWDGDATWWTGRAPILFPVIGLLNGGCYRLDGKRYTMPKHGFARRSLFDGVEHTTTRAVLRLTDSDETRAMYPFAFMLDIAFVLDGATLSITATVTNRSAEPMPTSFGFHPALRWPLPYGGPREAHRIVFEHDEPAPIRRIGADGLLLGESAPTPVAGDTLALRDVLFEDDALIFDQIVSRRVRYGAQTGPQLVVDFPDAPVLGVWTKPGAGFICIEPWQGLPDPVDYNGDLRDKPGIVEVAPGGSRTFRMSIRIEHEGDAHDLQR